MSFLEDFLGQSSTTIFIFSSAGIDIFLKKGVLICFLKKLFHSSIYIG